ncbi:MAG: hypothetical protein AAB840_01825 [Patescibacteria group bacterium]
MNKGKKTQNIREVNNVWNETKYLAFNVYKKTSITIFIIAIFSLIILPFFIISLSLIPIYVAFLYIKATKQFMRHFAKINGLLYSETAVLESVSGRLFQVGHSQSITNVISGAHLQYPIRIFNYKYTVGSGKHSQTYNFTILEMSFEKTVFPHIILQSKKMWGYAGYDILGNIQDSKIHLVGPFEDVFQLYSENGYEIEVLQIFTPEILSHLQENAKNFSIEFSANHMYIFDDKTLGTMKELNTLFDVSKKILSSNGEIIDRLHDDFSALHPYYQER